MKNLTFFVILIAAVAAVGQQRQTAIQASPAAASAAAASGPIPFTYQGKLNFNSIPANGQFDFTVYLCDKPDPADQPADNCPDRREINAVAVSGGIFTIHLDLDTELFVRFDNLYLDIQVRQSGSSEEFTALTPRQQIDSTPYSHAAKALTCTSCITDGHIVSVNAAKINGKVASAANADNATNAVNAQNAANATFAATAQNALNAVDLTNAQTIAGNKSFSGILSGNGSGLINVPGTLKWSVSSAGTLQLQPNNGYVLTNTTAATVTLPASPNVGDVVRVIEKGSGGFTLAMNQGQSVLDWATTHQETIWTRQYSQTASSTTNPYVWRSIASSTDGVKLAAVENPGFIYTSTDSGQTWIQRETSRNWISIASSSDGTKLLAAVENGYLYASSDSGVTWGAVLNDANRSWSSVASSGSGLNLVAAGTGGIYLSSNGGVSWGATGLSTGGQYAYVASNGNGRHLTAALYSGHVYVSANFGISWTDALSGTNNQWASVASDSTGAKRIAIENVGKVWISSDFGLTWTGKILGPAGINTNWVQASMSSDGQRIALAAARYDFGCCTHRPGELDISYDGGTSWTPTGTGQTWSAVSVAGNGNWVSAAMGGDETTFVNKLYSGPVTTQTFIDTITGVKDSAIELVYIGNNQFAMVSSTGMTIPPQTY